MPYKDYEYHKQKMRERYAKNKDKWKNPDGSWKRASNYGTDEYRAKKRAWYTENAEDQRAKVRARRRAKRIYGICPICKTDTRLIYDHNRETNQYRDHICQACNLALGHARENIQVLRGLINYIKKHNNVKESS